MIERFIGIDLFLGFIKIKEIIIFFGVESSSICKLEVSLYFYVLRDMR